MLDNYSMLYFISHVGNSSLFLSMQIRFIFLSFQIFHSFVIFALNFNDFFKEKIQKFPSIKHSSISFHKNFYKTDIPPFY